MKRNDTRVGMLLTVTFTLVCGVCLLPEQGNAATILQFDSPNYVSSTGTWTDTSGNGNNATQATAGNRPALVAGATPTGQPALQFNPAAPDFLTLNSVINSSAFTLTPGFSMVVVADPLFTGSPGTDVPPRGSMIGAAYYGAASYNIQDYSGVNAQEGEKTGYAGVAQTSGSGLGWNVFAMTYDGSVGLLYLNGVLVASNPISLTFTNGNDGVTPARIDEIGASFGGSSYQFNGEIAAVRVYDNVLSGTSIASLSAQLADTYITAPEPSTLVLAGIAGVLLLSSRRRAQNHS